MLRLENPDLIPPGGWRYTQEIPGRDSVKITAHSFNQLMHKIELLRAGNGLDMTPGWEVRVEGELCQQLNLGPGHCMYRPTTIPDAKEVTLRDVLVFLAVLKSWIATGRQWVSQEEADRRARICSQCPLNHVPSGCSACSNLVAAVTAVIGDRHTPYDNKLHACRVCGCSARAHVHVPIEALARGVNETMAFPDYCWKASAVEMVRQNRLDREQYEKDYPDE